MVHLELMGSHILCRIAVEAPSCCCNNACLVYKATSSTSSTSEPILKLNDDLCQSDRGLPDGLRHFVHFLCVMALFSICATSPFGKSVHLDAPFASGSSSLTQESCLVLFSDVGFLSLSPACRSVSICLSTGVWWSFAEPTSRSCVNHSLPTLWSIFGFQSLAGLFFWESQDTALRFAKRNCHAQHVSASSTDFLAGEGLCEVHHKACKCDADVVDDIFVGTFVATPFINRDAGQ